MNYIKRIFTSRSRLIVMATDFGCLAISFMIYALMGNPFRFPFNMLAVFLQCVLCFALLIFFNAYETVDCGFSTISRCVCSLVSSSVLTILLMAPFRRVTFKLVGSYLIPVLVMIIMFYVVRSVYTYFAVEMKNLSTRMSKKPVLIVGAGSAGQIILFEIASGHLPYYPVCMVDDNRRLINTKVNGIAVEGSTSDIPELVQKYSVDTIIIAIPSISTERMNEIIKICSGTKCFIKTLPPIADMLKSGASVGKSIKDIRMEDLLCRDPISADTEKVREMVTGRVCMVTGGGGSIGSELCRQIMSYSPGLLVIVDIYENSAYDIQQELRYKYGADAPLKVEIASVRDADKMDRLFDKYRPSLVFHAAAHKHVPLMEYSAEETVKNNVFGTYNVANMAIKYKAERFLLISTDKAVNPTNVMGASKRCCEKVVKFFSDKDTDTTFVTVRFGNVLGSNGSVVPLFEKQIQRGGPVTITHPDIRRYFMTIPEAVTLVLQAETMAQSGQIFVLDMGKPIKILDMAENLIRMHGYVPYEDIEIKFTGLREGEKLFEELRLDEEEIIPTYNEKIFIGKHIELSDDFYPELMKLREYAEKNDGEAVTMQYKKLVPSFVPDERIHAVTSGM